MKTVSVTAHFDGERILLDEVLELEPNTKLIVTVLPGPGSERALWQSLAEHSLAGAYADDEEGYSLNDVKVVNPAYEGR
jgi:hypothetical protein